MIRVGQVSMGKLKCSDEGPQPMTWCLKPTGPNHVSGPIIPGVYALQNKASETYVGLSPDESTVSCWPETELEKTGVKLVCFRSMSSILHELMSAQWEILPLGGGYTIRLHGTDKYCTLQSGMGNRAIVTVSKIPAAWRIVLSSSPVLANEGYAQ